MSNLTLELKVDHVRALLTTGEIHRQVIQFLSQPCPSSEALKRAKLLVVIVKNLHSEIDMTSVKGGRVEAKVYMSLLRNYERQKDILDYIEAMKDNPEQLLEKVPGKFPGFNIID